MSIKHFIGKFICRFGGGHKWLRGSLTNKRCVTCGITRAIVARKRKPKVVE